jgi:hypothetical protein
MAGFLTKLKNSFQQNDLSDFLKEVSSLGLGYRDKVIKNSRAFGNTQTMLTNGMSFLNTEDDYAMFLALSIPDINLRKNIAFFDKQYYQKRETLRSISMQDEIEDILNIIADEAIVYNEDNYFCIPNKLKLNLTNKDEIEKSVEKNLKKIYTYFGFQDDNAAWSYFYKWLVDGYLAFEIIYDDIQKNIIGFKEIDVITLEPGMDISPEGDAHQVWYQYKGDNARERMLYDSQIIYISYSSINSPSRISYVERLVRAFNILRIMEQTRLIWAVVNSSFKLKFVIPVGGKSNNRAKQSLSQLMQRYNEDISFNDDEGSVSIQGKPNLPFMKQFWFPEKDGASPTVETVGGDGPDLADTEALRYFQDKLKLVSKIPFSRFERMDGGGNVDITGEQLGRDERKFGRFIQRLRRTWGELIVKPLWLQMYLDYPALKDDVEFRASIGIDFVKDNYFEEVKEIELTNKKLDYINNFANLMDADGTSPYFPIEFLIKKYLRFTTDEIAEIDELKKKARTAATEA